MKKIVILMAVLLAIAVIITACGGGNNAGAVGAAPGTTSAGNGPTQQPASGGGSWAGIPTYPGATLTESGQVTPVPGSGLSKIEARYYETSDTPEKVENFYKAQMPADGWQSQGWIETGMIGGVYTRDDTETVQISILPTGPNGKTMITLTWGTK